MRTAIPTRSFRVATRPPRLPWCAAALAALLCCPAHTVRASERLLVGAAASLRGAMTALVPALERALPGVQVEVTYGASNTLARQIAEGAPIDLFVSADERTMDGLEQKGLLAPGSRAPLLGNALVALA